MELTPVKLTTKSPRRSDPAPGASTAAPLDAGQVEPGSPAWHRLARRARILSWISLGWLGIEAGLAVIAAVLAGSVALLGFGIDSGIEALASVIVIWRFTGTRTQSPTSERRAQHVVALSFFLLAPYVVAESLQSLIAGRHAETTWLGIATAVLSLMWCPLLGAAKQRIGRRLGSLATTGEGRQNLLCAYMAVAVLVGLVANTVFGVWWLDPTVGLLIAGLAVKEGRRSWRGEPCTCCA